MELTFKVLNSDEDLSELASLASKIWNSYYPPIIGQAQVNYMLGKFYSMESLKDQIIIGNIFTAAYIKDEMIAFLSYSMKSEDDYFVHKLYVNINSHNKGVGRSLFDHVFKNLRFKTIRLTVNRHNYKAVNFYFRIGFVIEDIIDIDIGNGFVMNDFVMIRTSV